MIFIAFDTHRYARPSSKHVLLAFFSWIRAKFAKIKNAIDRDFPSEKLK